MRNVLVFAALLATQTTPAQERFVSDELADFYQWFHQRSQVDELYQGQTTLYTFSSKTKVYSDPCQDSKTIATLPIAHPVTNIAYSNDYYLPEDEIDGYGDIWYHVTGRSVEGRAFEGYIWGAQIAKGWQSQDITGDRREEFLMLGIASEPRRQLRNIKAELRIVRGGQLQSSEVIPGLCVFEDCAASPLLQVEQSEQGFYVIEASTMTVGCWAGIERAFYVYNGKRLSRVYHAEYTTQEEFANESFVVSGGEHIQVCQYSHQGSDYLPVWTCHTMEKSDGRAAVALELGKEQMGK